MAPTNRLVRLRRRKGLRGLSRTLLGLYGVELPAQVEVGAGFELRHGGFGVVVNRHTTIGDRVTIFHGVTIGRADATLVPYHSTDFVGVEIGDDVILGTGSIVLGGPGVTRVAEGTVLGAGSVLLRSTGPWEIWAGSPARKVGDRPRPGGSEPVPRPPMG